MSPPPRGAKKGRSNVHRDRDREPASTFGSFRPAQLAIGLDASRLRPSQINAPRCRATPCRPFSTGIRQKLDNRFLRGCQAGVGLINDNETLAKICPQSATPSNPEYEMCIAPEGSGEQEKGNQRDAIMMTSIENHVGGRRRIYP